VIKATGQGIKVKVKVTIGIKNDLILEKKLGMEAIST
jgi:hypothetical protein